MQEIQKERPRHRRYFSQKEIGNDPAYSEKTDSLRKTARLQARLRRKPCIRKIQYGEAGEDEVSI